MCKDDQLSETDQSKTQIEEALLKQLNPATAPSEFKRNKLINEAARNWDIFYKRNTTNFFKDRHWTMREFPELQETGHEEPNSKTSPSYNTERCKGFLCDLTKDSLSDNVPIESLDIVSAIFMLSAVPPFKMAYVVENIKQVLKPGGVILFRDYGLHDAAQLRFKAENRIDDCFYTRSDGTFSYYFSKEYFKNLFEPAGFEILDCGYVTKEVVNRKQDMKMDRIFLQARLRKK
ncbi:hypothetical protein BSLG_007353 [Batrachochytrium salamandrivorans]|nr:hypothetical protein BSLG_007353 [Batrachochytrium salamandrivorans]